MRATLISFLLSFQVAMGIESSLESSRLSSSQFCTSLFYPLPIVKQSTSYTCGPASLDCVLKYWGRYSPGEWTLAIELGVSGSYLYAGNLAIRALQSGLHSKLEYNRTFIDLARSIEAGETVIVAYVIDGMDHYSVVQALTHHSVYLMDPWNHVGENPFSYRQVPIVEFLSMWWPAKYSPMGGTIVRISMAPL